MDTDEAIRFVSEKLFDFFYMQNVSNPKMILTASRTKNKNLEVTGFLLIDGVVFFVRGFFLEDKHEAWISLENGDNRISNRIEY